MADAMPPVVSKRSGKTPTRKSRTSASSASVGRRLADALQLAEQLADGVDRDLGLHRRAGREGADRAARIEGAARAVRVAQLLAQSQVEAAAEHAAEQRRHDHGREVARVESVDPEVPDAQLALDRSRPIDQHDAPAAALGRLDGPVLRPGPCPVAQVALDGRDAASSGSIAPAITMSATFGA